MSEKPKCVECGSDKVISKGMSWYCKTCGRWFIKKRRGIFLKRVKEYTIKEWDRLCRKNGYQPIYGFEPMVNSELSRKSQFINRIAEKFGISLKEVISSLGYEG